MQNSGADAQGGNPSFQAGRRLSAGRRPPSHVCPGGLTARNIGFPPQHTVHPHSCVGAEASSVSTVDSRDPAPRAHGDARRDSAQGRASGEVSTGDL